MAVYSKSLPLETADIYDHFLNQHGSLSRYSRRLLPSGAADSGSDEGEDEDVDTGSDQPGARQLSIGFGDLAIGGPLVSSIHYLQSAAASVRPAAALVP